MSDERAFRNLRVPPDRAANSINARLRRRRLMLNAEKWKEIERIHLRRGVGKTIQEACVMQAVDYVTSGGLSDHPGCVCPALTIYAIRLNDRADDETRQRLKPLIPKLVDTKDENAKGRAEFLAHHSIAVILPILCDALGLTEASAKLRGFEFGEWKVMEEFCYEIRPVIQDTMEQERAATYAASYAADAATYASYAARETERKQIWDAAFEGLTKACEIGLDKNVA
jgi:hypothetical protein